jgi:AbrB family looped-hinge helix DNA binding protein
MAYLLKLDKKGRLTLPAEVKRRLNIRTLVRLEDRGDRLEIVPVQDPLEKLKGSAKIHISSSEELDELAEKIVSKESLR